MVSYGAGSRSRRAGIVRPVVASLGVGVVAALVVAALRPTPWLLALLLVALLIGIWAFAFGARVRASRTGAPAIAS